MNKNQKYLQHITRHRREIDTSNKIKSNFKELYRQFLQILVFATGAVGIYNSTNFIIVLMWILLFLASFNIKFYLYQSDLRRKWK